MLKNKLKLSRGIKSGILVGCTTLYAFASIMNIYVFFDNKYSWWSLAIGTLWFIFFVFCLLGLSPEKFRKKIIFIVCSLWCVTIFVSATIGYINRERSTEYNLLGEWVSETDEVKSKITFEGDENDLEGTWSVYDYVNNKKEVIKFEVENIEEFSMEIVTKDGDIMFVPFAVSKDTLYFDGIGHKNLDKNVKIPKKMEKYDTYKTYVRKGVMTPVGHGLFLGMSKNEVEKVIKPARLKEEIGYYQYEIPGTDISCHLDFFKGELHCIELYVEDINTMDGAIDYLSELYGDYKTERWSVSDDYIRYEWESYNLIVNINYNTKDKKYYWISYRL